MTSECKYTTNSDLDIPKMLAQMTQTAVTSAASPADTTNMSHNFNYGTVTSNVTSNNTTTQYTVNDYNINTTAELYRDWYVLTFKDDDDWQGQCKALAQKMATQFACIKTVACIQPVDIWTQGQFMAGK